MLKFAGRLASLETENWRVVQNLGSMENDVSPHSKICQSVALGNCSRRGTRLDQRPNYCIRTVLKEACHQMSQLALRHFMLDLGSSHN